MPRGNFAKRSGGGSGSPSLNSSGSQTGTIATEFTLATLTLPGIYLLVVDVSAMLGGATPDLLILREYTKARSSDAEGLIKPYNIVGLQAETEIVLPYRTTPHYLRYTLQQTQGTARTYPWAIYQLN